jgi:class 3 adenylate cyclase
VTPITSYLRTADGIYLAYQVVGSGPIDVAIDFHSDESNVDLMWEEPDWRPLLVGISEFARLILHDRRGTGASSRNVPPPNLETRVADLLAVLDEVESKAPVLMAGWVTGAMHALFAAAHPDRASGFVWNNPAARAAWDPAYPWGRGPEEFEEAIEQGKSWGTIEYAREIALVRAAERAGIPYEERHRLTVDEDLVRLYAKINRNTASPDVAEALTRISWQTDVRNILASVHTATALVVGDDDERAEADYVASLMPHASVHVLPGRSGVQVDGLLRIIRDLGGIEMPPAGMESVLAAVLFTDIVGSTQTQASLGDRAWRDVIHGHHAVVREALARWDGTEHDTAGDGFFASFRGPARAVHCALDIAARVVDLGIETRAAVHIGECELIDGKPGGLAVVIGARALAAAGAREVIVTQTVKDLVAGSGFAFEDRGEHELKGVPDRWRLYTAAESPGSS